MKHTYEQSFSQPKRRLQVSVLSACLLIPAGWTAGTVTAFAQVANGSLSGTVTDTTGAIIPGATVALRNDLSGDTRTLKSNASGSFTFAGLPTGDYTISITAKSFAQLSESGLHLDPGDSRTIPSLQLKGGAENTTVTVEADTGVPLDTGERADLITAEEIKHLAIEGRDVTELFKTLPGFAINNTGGGGGVATNAAYDPSQVSVNGALGSYAANGNPLSGVSLKLDGADITDPGNYGAATQTVNYDQVSEVKVEVSNFGADIANGPVVVNVASKAGGNQFHGELYTYARTYQTDSEDALAKATGAGKDMDRELYPGGEIGGPILIPGTNFNHNRALTFFAGAEDYVQRNIYAYGGSSGALVHALVPTAAMRAGNFSITSLQQYLGGNGPNSLFGNSSYSGLATIPSLDQNGNTIMGGMIPMSDQDPGYQAIQNTFPLPNAVPTSANPYNYQHFDTINNDLYQVTGRVDVAISQKNHLFGRYTVERGVQGNPAQIYYNPGGINAPGGGIETTNSQSSAANLTTILSSTLTNQLFGTLAYLDAAYTTSNASALTAYPYEGLYANGRHPLPALVGYNANAQGLPDQPDPDFSLSPVFAHKFDPSGGDTVVKVWGKHTASFGVFIERITNNQKPPFQLTNGQLSPFYYGPAGATFVDADGKTTRTLSGNFAADYYEGLFGGYTQQSLLPDTNLYYWNNDFFANDSWRVLPKLTVNFGLRVEHLGLWNDAYGRGLAVFNPALIASGVDNSPFPGFLWHAIDPSLPVSGNSSKPAFLEPRVGFALDVHGDGSTVLAGGWGEYRSHDSWNDVSNALLESQNAPTSSTGEASLSVINALPKKPVIAGTPPNVNTYPSGLSSAALANPSSYTAPGSMYGLTPGDNEEPLTDTYSLTLNQRFPGKMVFILGYVGDNSRFLYNDGSSQTVALDNVNAIPIGGLYRPNPYTGQVLTPTGTNPASGAATVVSSAGTSQVNQYRPLNTALVQYGAIDAPRHNLFSNYNGMQVALTRQTGRVLFNVNYTFSKALGIQGELGTGTPGNPFNVYDNYGPQPFDRTSIFNAAYTFIEGSPFHNKLLGAFANGYELSGITNFQSGPDILTTTNSPGFTLQGTIGATSSPNAIAITNTAYLGTPDVSLQPTILCDPHSNLGPRQYANGNCFGTPNLLQNGPYRQPVLRGPAFFDSDLSLQRSVPIRHEQNVVVRVSAFNFLNHALPSFSSDFPNEYTLNLTNPAGTTFNQGVNNPANQFGTAAYELGRRVTELSVKYNF